MKGQQDLHLVHFVPPHKEISTVTDTISCFFDEGDPDHFWVAMGQTTTRVARADPTVSLCPFDHPPGDRILVLAVDVCMTQNTLGEACILASKPLFESRGAGGPADASPRVQHPDLNGGILRFAVPAHETRAHTSLSLYVPRFTALGINITHYLGLEMQIMNANSTCVTDEGIKSGWIAFRHTDPILVFALENRQHFPGTEASDMQKVKNFYLLSKAYVQDLQAFFQDAVFPHYHYVKPDVDRLHFTFEQLPRAGQRGFVGFTLKLTYVRVTPQTLLSGFKVERGKE